MCEDERMSVQMFDKLSVRVVRVFVCDRYRTFESSCKAAGRAYYNVTR